MLKAPKFQAKFQAVQKFSSSEIYSSSKGKGLRDIGYKMSMVLDKRNQVLWVKSRCGFIFGSLLHFITKCNSYLITKCDKSLLESASAFNTKCEDFITKCDSYYNCVSTTLNTDLLNHILTRGRLKLPPVLLFKSIKNYLAYEDGFSDF